MIVLTIMHIIIDLLQDSYDYAHEYDYFHAYA